MARLVALTVVGAPQVLMDLFGHANLEMTLRYMLSHPDIAAEADRVARVTAFANAEEAISETLQGKTAGRGTQELRDGLTRWKMRLGIDEFGTTTLRETAEILTFNGLYWQAVRPGVLCTKTLHQRGPCTQSKGEPDPGACRTDCRHRLELERARAGCSDSIKGLLQELEEARRSGSWMLLENLSGTLLSELSRWDDVRAHWLRESSLASEIWNSARS
jgi:hypothetical protein